MTNVLVSTYNNTSPSTSLSTEQHQQLGILRHLPSIAFAGCLTIGSWVAPQQFANPQNSFTHSSQPMKVQSREESATSTSAQMARKSAVAYSSSEIPILSYETIAYNGDIIPSTGEMEAITLKKTTAPVNSGLGENPSWNRVVDTLLEGTRPFTPEEKVMYAKVVKKQSVVKRKLYNL